MTIKEKIKGLFKKSTKIQPFVKFDKKEITLKDLEEEFLDEFEEELKLWASADDGFSLSSTSIKSKHMDPVVPQEPVESKSSDLYERFKSENPGKKALYGGKETKAFLKWKEDNNL
jgi:hypothetical protein